MISRVYRLLKEPIERAISSPPIASMTRRRLEGKRLILAYHGIVPEGESPAGERAIFVTQRAFAMQLDVLAAEADVVPLDRIDDTGNGRPRVAITFDDAYSGAVNQGVRELAKRGLPATIFVVPGRLNGHIFWWDALSHGSATLDPTVRHHALTELMGADERVRAWAANEAMPASDALPAYARAATRAELDKALAFPGITVGSHTWSHPNLATLGASDVVAEVRRSREWLRAEFGDKALDWIAYPYGLDSEAVHRAVADALYKGALGIGGGWHRSSEVSRFARPRFSIGSGLSLAGLRTRLSGARLA
jgi:peptidoglycan/xylan/chitin deacetylase (PgdA/CDA1 family)